MNNQYKYPTGATMVSADYSGHGPEQTNPLIAALQPSWSRTQLASAMTWWPDHDILIHQKPKDERWDLCFELQDGYEVLPQGITIIKTILREISRLYRGRDQYVHRYTSRIHEKAALQAANNENGVQMSGTSNTMLVYGLPGTGKTSLMRELSTVLPPVIDHVNFRGTPWPCRQVTHLRVAAQQNWTDKALGQAILLEFDKVAGTQYTAEVNRRQNPSVFNYLLAFNIAANNHGLGALIIDEVQLLKTDATLLNFILNFTSMNNVLLVLVGTPASVSIIGEDPRFMRRADHVIDTELKRFEFPAMSVDDYNRQLTTSSESIDIWTWFVQAFWGRQYTARPTPLAYELSQHLNWLSAGLPSYATKIFISAQLARIGTAKDYLDKDAFDVAYAAFTPESKKYLDALRNNRFQDLSKHADFAHLDPSGHAKSAALAREEKRKAAELAKQEQARKAQAAQEVSDAKGKGKKRPTPRTPPKPIDLTDLTRASKSEHT
jgi:hypothetical protein